MLTQRRYLLELVLDARFCSPDSIKDSLSELGEELDISKLQDIGEPDEFRIKIKTPEPTLIFDACSQLGRIKSAKVEEF